MIPAAFEYHRPETLEEAIALLGKLGDDAKVLSGGHSLIPALRLRLAAPRALVDISRLPGLGEIRRHGDGIAIGALVTHHRVIEDPLVRERCPLLARTAPEIGDVQVRNAGTLVGAVCHADPAGDWPGALLALDAQVVIAGPGGGRTMPLDEFLEGMLATRLAQNEIVREIAIPASHPPTCAYRKIHQSASGFAIAGAAVELEVENGACRQIAVGINGVAPRAYRARAVEGSLRGARLEPKAIRAAAARATEGIAEPLSDMHASSAYRAALAEVLVLRALLEAAGIEE